MIEIRPAAAAALALAIIGVAQPAHAQIADVRIEWEVRNRFRLFAEEKDFLAAEERYKNTKTILAAEQAAGGKDGEGWAQHVGRLCFDALKGRTPFKCRREGAGGELFNETYINPARHPVRFWIAGHDGDECEWSIVSGPEKRKITAPCREKVNYRFTWRAEGSASVVVRRGDQIVGQSSKPEPIAVQDLLVVGMGDSIASGEGNPTRAVQLNGWDGFCYRRSSGSFFKLPARKVDFLPRDCDAGQYDQEQIFNFKSAGATWMHAPCHASLYGYQARAALALAVRETKQAVTFVPLACSGAEIQEGVIIRPGNKGAQAARERPWSKDANGKLVRPDPFVETQVSRLRTILTSGPGRPHADVILLTIGANDVGFSKLVADVMISGEAERDLLKKQIIGPEESRKILASKLPADFRELRRQLSPLVNGDLGRVVFTTYGNPARDESGACRSTRLGFDAHPGFAVNGAKLARTADYVENGLVPGLKALTTCENGACPPSQRMTYVDGHRTAFASRGFCAQSDDDPAFDKLCFRDGGTFSEDMDNVMACKRSAREFRPYAPRARWVRTANDSYLAAATHPENIREWIVQVDPSDLRDKAWGLAAPVFGGAIHPTAEGHAAMADAVLPKLAAVEPQAAPRRTR